MLQAPLTDPDAHPIMVHIGENAPMKAFDISIMVGNFKSKGAADTAGKAVVKLLQTHFGASANVLQ